MQVLITGANGFLGSALVPLFRNTGIEVIKIGRKNIDGQLVCDLLDADALANLKRTISPDLVIHCAALVPKQASDYDNPTVLLANTSMFSNLISITNCPIIYISSMTVYGDSPNTIRSEEDAGNPSSKYGFGKYKGEILLKNSGRDGVAVRLPGLFGGARKAGLIANTINSLIKGEKPSLPLQPLIWAAMDVQDAAKSIFQLSLTRIAGFKPVNIAYREMYSVNRFVSICEEIFAITIPYNVVHPDFSFDLSTAESLNIMSTQNLKSTLICYKNKILNMLSH